MFGFFDRSESPNRRKPTAKLNVEHLEHRVTPTTGLTLEQLNLESSFYSPSNILVRFDPSQPAGTIAAGLPAGAALGEPVDNVPGLYEVGLSGIDVRTALESFLADPDVLYAQPDYIIHTTQLPNDPSFGQQWYLENTGQSSGTPDADIDADRAWDVTTGGGKQVVAVLDTGVEVTHPDLYLNIYLNEAEIPFTIYSQLQDVDGDNTITVWDLNNPVNQGPGKVNDLNFTGYIDLGDVFLDPAWMDGIDTDGNGFADDFSGWDFINGDPNPSDDQTHGTHVAGIIGAMGNNGVGVAGVNWNVQILPLKIFDDQGSGTEASALGGINYSVDHGAKVANASWGTNQFSFALLDGLTAARDAGQVFLAAAGNGSIFGIGQDNDSIPFYPASYDLDNIVAVAATDRNDELTRFSNYGVGSVDLAAPGGDILSTMIDGTYGLLSGTSMATPQVAGSVALVWELHPTWTYSQVIDEILATVDPVTPLQGLVGTGGRLNLARALGNGEPPPPPPPTGSLPAWETFADGKADFFVPRSGLWSVTGGRYEVEPVTDSDNVVNVSTLGLDSLATDGDLFVSVLMNVEEGVPGFPFPGLIPEHLTNGFIVFDYQGLNDYKFAGADMIADRWIIGHVDSFGWHEDAYFGAAIDASTDYVVSLMAAADGSVTLYANGQQVLSHFFLGDLTDGDLGLATRDATAKFDNVSVDDFAGVVDNSTAGFAAPGFSVGSGLDGVLGSYAFSHANTGNSASWTFGGLSPFQTYEFLATWVPFSNRASNATYTLSGIVGGPRTVTVNQRLVPNGETRFGEPWQTLGNFAPTGGTVTITLSDAGADGVVIADGVRLEGLGAVPEVLVTDAGSEIADGSGSVDFGTALQMSPVTRTFTVTNLGSKPLTLDPGVSLPGGFSLASGFGSTLLFPGQSTTFAVRLDAVTMGSFSGQVSFATDDPDENPFNFTISGVVSDTVIIENGDPGFSAPGFLPASGRGSYSTANAGNTATWTFTGLTPGESYRLAGTWIHYTNRASNAPFTISGVQGGPLPFAVNQKVAPNDFADAGLNWETFGTFLATGSTITVSLTDVGINGDVVIADAVHLRRVEAQPEIEVTLGGANVADGGGPVGFGLVLQGATSEREFTVRNTGTGPLNLGGIDVPAGFTVASGFGSTTLGPGESTTFRVGLVTDDLGSFSGQLSFTTDDVDENPFNFAVSGEVALVAIVQNGDAGFSAPGFLPASGRGSYSPANAGNTATWTFTGLTVGQSYQVSGSWIHWSNRASNSPFTVTGVQGGPVTFFINQKVAPNDFSDRGLNWETLGTFVATSETLVVSLTDVGANGIVIADAVHLKPVVTAPEIEVRQGAASVGDGGSFSYGPAQYGQPVTKTFTVTNTGAADLTLGTIDVPDGYTLTGEFDLTTLPAGQSTTFSVQLDTADLGRFSGEISFATNDADENPFNFTVSATVVEVIENGDGGFDPGGFTPANGRGSYSHANSGNTATWIVGGLTAGQNYSFSATWIAYSNRASNAPFTISGVQGGPVTVNMNQKVAPNDLTEFGLPWETLGTFIADGEFVTISLTDVGANGVVIADAVRVEKVSYRIIENGDAGFDAPGFLPASGRGSYSTANAGNTATWTFTGLNAGATYRISATWIHWSNRASNSPFTLSGIDGGPTTFFMNQKAAPNDFSAQGLLWEDFGTFTMTGDTLVVSLTDVGANGIVIADAIRIEEV